MQVHGKRSRDPDAGLHLEEFLDDPQEALAESSPWTRMRKIGRDPQ